MKIFFFFDNVKYIYILFPRNILNVITRDYSNFIDYKLFAIRIFWKLLRRLSNNYFP